LQEKTIFVGQTALYSHPLFSKYFFARLMLLVKLNSDPKKSMYQNQKTSKTDW
jgi:hypothetical protein